MQTCAVCFRSNDWHKNVGVVMWTHLTHDDPQLSEPLRSHRGWGGRRSCGQPLSTTQELKSSQPLRKLATFSFEVLNFSLFCSVLVLLELVWLRTSHSITGSRCLGERGSPPAPSHVRNVATGQWSSQTHLTVAQWGVVQPPGFSLRSTHQESKQGDHFQP